jgi:hypothetical protein
MSETPKRPGVVLAAAIILFIFGGLSLLGIFGAIIPYVTPARAAAPQRIGNQPQFVDPTPKLVQEEPALMGVMTAFALFSAVLGAVKIWAGIGILQLRPSARIMGIIVSALTFLLTIVQSAHSALFFVPAYLRVFRQENPPEIGNFMGLVEAIFWIATGLGIVVSIALWLTVILLLNSKRSRDAFAGISDEPAEERKRESRSRCDDYEEEYDAYPRSTPRSASDDTGITDRPH